MGKISIDIEDLILLLNKDDSIINKLKQQYIKTCAFCGKEFFTRYFNAKYCRNIPAGYEKPCNKIAASELYKLNHKEEIKTYQRDYARKRFGYKTMKEVD
jgi:hypothetical protein